MSLGFLLSLIVRWKDSRVGHKRDPARELKSCSSKQSDRIDLDCVRPIPRSGRPLERHLDGSMEHFLRLAQIPRDATIQDQAASSLDSRGQAKMRRFAPIDNDHLWPISFLHAEVLHSCSCCCCCCWSWWCANVPKLQSFALERLSGRLASGRAANSFHSPPSEVVNLSPQSEASPLPQ